MHLERVVLAVDQVLARRVEVELLQHVGLAAVHEASAQRRAGNFERRAEVLELSAGVRSRDVVLAACNLCSPVSSGAMSNGREVQGIAR